MSAPNLSLLRLLQLASPALPVGAYAYSQGLEWAIEAGTVVDEAGALRWIADQLEWNIGRYEAPLLRQYLDAWQTQGQGQGGPTMATCAMLIALDEAYLATRESAELRAETVQMGFSMRRLLEELGEFPLASCATLRALPEPSFLLVWSYAAAHWQISRCDALSAWCWSWAENQTMAALKAVPLGQAAGQRILSELGRSIPAIVERALDLPDADYSNFAPGFALACSRHETQYSRLFRS